MRPKLALSTTLVPSEVTRGGVPEVLGFGSGRLAATIPESLGSPKQIFRLKRANTPDARYPKAAS